MKLLIICLFCLFSSLSAQSLKKANAYAETGFEDKAESSYQALLEKPLESWQQDIIFYNLGTLYLNQQLWKKALSQFIEVRVKSMPPYLVDKYQTNFGLSLVGRAGELLLEDKPVQAAVFLTIAQDKIGKTKEGAALYQRAIKSIKNPEISEILRSIQEKRLPDIENPFVKQAAKTSGASQKIFLLAAAESLGRKMPQKQTMEAVAVLQNALEEQEEALDLTALQNIYNAQKDLSPEILQTIQNKQSKTLEIARQFVPAAIQMQKDLLKEGCLDQVWKDIVNEFGSGLETAEKADRLLKKNADLVVVDDYQIETVNLWKKALERLQVAEKTQAPKEAKATKSQTNQELIQTVIQMELQDQTAPKKSPELKKIDKPW